MIVESIEIKDISHEHDETQDQRLVINTASEFEPGKTIYTVNAHWLINHLEIIESMKLDNRIIIKKDKG